MKKAPPSQSAFFNLRVLIGLFIALAAVFLALLGVGAFSRASAQGSSQNPGIQVTPSYHNETWPRLRNTPLSPKTPLPEYTETDTSGAVGVTQDVQTTQEAYQVFGGNPDTVTVGVSVTGILGANSFCGCLPPDTNAAAGPTDVVEVVNTAMEIIDKSGNLVSGPTSLVTFFSGHGFTVNSLSDPVVIFDESVVNPRARTAGSSSLSWISPPQTLPISWILRYRMMRTRPTASRTSDTSTWARRASLPTSLAWASTPTLTSSSSTCLARQRGCMTIPRFSRFKNPTS